jgi:hypothetical protein
MITSLNYLHRAPKPSLLYNKLHHILEIKTMAKLSTLTFSSLQRPGFKYKGATFSALDGPSSFKEIYLRGKSHDYHLMNACLIHLILMNSQELKIDFLQ